MIRDEPVYDRTDYSQTSATLGKTSLENVQVTILRFFAVVINISDAKSLIDALMSSHSGPLACAILKRNVNSHVSTKLVRPDCL